MEISLQACQMVEVRQAIPANIHWLGSLSAPQQLIGTVPVFTGLAFALPELESSIIVRQSLNLNRQKFHRVISVMETGRNVNSPKVASPERNNWLPRKESRTSHRSDQQLQSINTLTTTSILI
ncbi:hypothetical protein ACRALDRAFT_213423 [Sodiomyces alcalophilus JCM 7366]|uniref:uncharacterized protein n=1 Tax=Sodiomyces alcalophilus JCM 7366 TaxID=591952 RepID=UPI0039B3804D